MISFDAKRDLRGIIASLHTPFTSNDEIDEKSLIRLIDHCAKAGCAGVLVAAVAGEVSALRHDERKLLLDLSAKASMDRLAVVAGISAASVEESVVAAKDAASFGIPMVMWQPPAGLAGDELIEALQRVADSGNLQIMLQDLDWGGGGLAPDFIAKMAKSVPAMTAVKIETVPAGPKYSAVAAICGDKLHLSGGWAVMQMLDGLARGLDAFIPSGLLPWQVKLFDVYANGQPDQARAMFEQMLPIMAFSNQHIDVSGRFWKKVRVAQGIFETDHCRLPKPLDAVQEAEAEVLAKRVIAMEGA